MDLTFGEIYARVQRGRRTDAVRALVALFVLARVEGSDTPATGEISDFIRLHAPAARPTNISTTLRRLAPGVQPVRSTSARETRWRLRSGGVRELEELTGLDLSGPVPEKALGYSLEKLHTEIRSACETLMKDRHYPEAVGRAMKALNRMVRQRTGRRRDDGTKMMHEVFKCESTNGKRLLLNALDFEWQEDRQDGFRFLMAGAQQGIANVDKHGELEIQGETEALEHLAMLSLFARLVERATVMEPEES